MQHWQNRRMKADGQCAHLTPSQTRKEPDPAIRAARATPKADNTHPAKTTPCAAARKTPAKATYQRPTQSGRRPGSTEKTDNDAQQTSRHHRPAIHTTQAQQPRNQTAQRYGKGRAANESETKPPNLDKKPDSKTANGRRVPLTDLLGYTISNKAKLLLLFKAMVDYL